MSELLADLERLAAVSADKRDESSVRLLAGALPPGGERCLRLAAIPHYFGQALLTRLDPSLSAESVEAAVGRLLRLGFCVELSGGLKLRNSVRRLFFEDWLREFPSVEFQALNRVLVEELRRPAGDSDELESRLQIVFHEIGADQDSGFTAFDELFRSLRTQFRLGACAALLEMVHEYDPVLAPVHAARLAYQEGKLASDRRQWKDAEGHFRTVLKRDAIPDRLRMKALLRLGTVHLDRGRWDAAIRAYSEARELAAEIPDPLNAAKSLYRLAIAYREAGEYASAISSLREYLADADTLGDWQRVAQAHNALGLVYLKQREPEEALQAFDVSLRNLEREGVESPRLLLNIGSAYADLPDFARSRECFDRSMMLSRGRGDAGGEAMALNNLARLHAAERRYTDAIRAATDSVALFERAHDFRSAGEASRNLALLQLRARRSPDGADPSLAAPALRRAGELFRRAGANDAAAAVERELERLGRRQDVPWWAWASIGVGVVALVALLLWLSW
jgi:tetratricopeptide (TPR) repeat protein